MTVLSSAHSFYASRTNERGPNRHEPRDSYASTNALDPTLNRATLVTHTQRMRGLRSSARVEMKSAEETSYVSSMHDHRCSFGRRHNTRCRRDRIRRKQMAETAPPFRTYVAAKIVIRRYVSAKPDTCAIYTIYRLHH